MADQSRRAGMEEREQFAVYVAQLSHELASTARRNGFEALGYLLEMVRMEAESIAHQPNASEAETKVAHG